MNAFSHMSNNRIEENLGRLLLQIEANSMEPDPIDEINTIEFVGRHQRATDEEIQTRQNTSRRRFLNAVRGVFGDRKLVDEIVIEIMNNDQDRVNSLKNFIPDMPRHRNYLNDGCSFSLDASTTTERKRIRTTIPFASIFSRREISHTLSAIEADPAIYHVPNLYFMLLEAVLKGLKIRYSSQHEGVDSPIFSAMSSEAWGQQVTINKFVVPALCVCAESLQSANPFSIDVREAAARLLKDSGAYEKHTKVGVKAITVRCPAQGFVTETLRSGVLETMYKIQKGQS